MSILMGHLVCGAQWPSYKVYFSCKLTTLCGGTCKLITATLSIATGFRHLLTLLALPLAAGAATSN